MHVAGTNGKGSVCSFITNTLKEQVYKVGLYTSPYLETFTERIRLKGRDCLFILRQPHEKKCHEGCSNIKKLKSLLVSLVLALVCVSMVTSTDVVEASSIKLNKTSLTIYIGKTSTLKVSGTSKKVTWSTSNKNITTVSSKVTVSAKSSGTITITAKVNNKNLRCKVTVKKQQLVKLVQVLMLDKQQHLN